MRKHIELFNHECMKRSAPSSKSSLPIVEWPKKSVPSKSGAPPPVPPRVNPIARGRWQLPKSATPNWPNIQMRTSNSDFSLPSSGENVAQKVASGDKMTFRFNFASNLEPVKVGAPEVIDRSPPWLHILKHGDASLRALDGKSSVLRDLFRKWANMGAITTVAPITTKITLPTTSISTPQASKKEEEEETEEEEEEDSTTTTATTKTTATTTTAAATTKASLAPTSATETKEKTKS